MNEPSTSLIRRALYQLGYNFISAGDENRTRSRSWRLWFTTKLHRIGRMARDQNPDCRHALSFSGALRWAAELVFRDTVPTRWARDPAWPGGRQHFTNPGIAEVRGLQTATFGLCDQPRLPTAPLTTVLRRSGIRTRFYRLTFWNKFPFSQTVISRYDYGPCGLEPTTDGYEPSANTWAKVPSSKRK